MSCGKLLYSQSEVQISAWSYDGCLSEVERGFTGLASLVVQLVKNPLANAEDTKVNVKIGLLWWLSGKESACHTRDLGLISGSGRSPGEGNGTPLQYSCLENPMDGRAWKAAVHGVAEGRT